MFLRNVSVLLSLFVILVACDGAGSAPDDVSEAVDCFGLSEEACGVSEDCGEPYIGFPLEKVCEGAGAAGGRYFGCSDKDQLCGLAFTWGHPVADPDDFHLFSNSCMPKGWTSAGMGSLCPDGSWPPPTHFR